MKKEIEDIRNKDLKEEIEDIRNKEIKALKEEIQILKKDNKEKEQIINELLLWKKEKENKSKFQIDSEIIDKKKELDFLTNRLKIMEQFKNKNISYQLIFRATKDGSFPKDFHEKCDGKDKTITIIKTIKGLKFGGYIDKKWGSNGGWVEDDENCFIFSLSLKKIYNPIKGKSKYYFSDNFGPDFALFGLNDNLFEKSTWNMQTKEVANKYFKHFESDYEIIGGELEFQIVELEVFQIICDEQSIIKTININP